MADTKRILSALQAILADNVTEDIAAQDVRDRDFLASVRGNWSSKTGYGTTKGGANG